MMSRRAERAWVRRSVMGLVAAAGLATPAMAQLVPQGAVLVEQNSYPLDGMGQGANSMVGSITVDYSVLASAFPGPLGGFVNVAYLPGGIQSPSSAVWLVHNLPIFGPGLEPMLAGASGYNAPSITTQFNLSPLPGAVAGVPLAVAQNVAVYYSPGPQETLNWVTQPGAIARNWNVSPLDRGIGGTGRNGDVKGLQPPPPLGPLPAGPAQNLLWLFAYRPDHPNQQAAHNQCAPMAISNVFTWMATNVGLPVLHPHNIGLEGTAPNYTPDASLVSTVGSLMKRFRVTRANGSGIWPIQGAMAYLTRHDMAHVVSISHRLNGAADRISGDPYTVNAVAMSGANDYNSPDTGMMSKGAGAAYSTTWLKDRLQDGSGLAMDWGPAQHYVSVVGAGFLNRRAFVLHVSDAMQTNVDPMDNKGCDRFDFDYVNEATNQLIQTAKPADQFLSFSMVSPQNLPIRCSTGNPIAIPNGSGSTVCGATAAAELVIPDDFKIGLVRPSFYITHTFQGDLRVTLTKVGGPSVVLVNRPGVSASPPFGFSADNLGASAANRFRSSNTRLFNFANYTTYNSPGVAAPGTNNVTGDWKPEQTLAAFVGQSAKGTWRLEVQDCATLNTGSIVSFCLEFATLSGGPLPCRANCDASTVPPVLNVNDFQCFLNSFNASLALPVAQQITAYANCDASTTSPVLNVNDFACFINLFSAGCTAP
ncbi:MAG: proprotein convertase P-domain-containing protein [Phycisphaerae bacterium]|nr:proprotein convertase P-domain-containing protein [Phycisphaerae bacterium]